MAARRARKKVNAETINEKVMDFVKTIKTDMERLEFKDVDLSQSIEEQKSTNKDSKLMTDAADRLKELSEIVDGAYIKQISEIRTEAVTDVLDTGNMSDEEKLKLLADKLFGIKDLSSLHKDGSVESPKEVVKPDINVDSKSDKSDNKDDKKSTDLSSKLEQNGSKKLEKPAPISGSGSIPGANKSSDSKPTFAPNTSGNAFDKSGNSSF